MVAQRFRIYMDTSAYSAGYYVVAFVGDQWYKHSHRFLEPSKAEGWVYEVMREKRATKETLNNSENWEKISEGDLPPVRVAYNRDKN